MPQHTKHYICIHGHFYQPPRENPWTGKVDKQLSAGPFHDWNHRITHECYEANLYSKILDDHGKVETMVNNYTHMSFNFGPTLLSWMQIERPDVYHAIIDSDHKSQQMYNGHGSAIAQSYNHIIMPLASFTDKYTQVYWGIKDFEYRFGRKPEGMWLSETAVNVETLDVMAALGIKYTILAPHQAKRIKKHWWSPGWTDVTQDKLDTTQPYLCKLPSGQRISIFFYDGPASADVAFGGLLHSGENMANRLVAIKPKGTRKASLAHIATDGETYGHHHAFGNMALAYCLNSLQQRDDVTLTNYGEYLEQYPPKSQVQIHEGSSWSCSHGIERWRSNCGCRMDTSKEPAQQWRGPLRYSLDWLRDQLSVLFEKQTRGYFEDPWYVRNEYIELILDPGEERAKEFFSHHAERELKEGEIKEFKQLYDMQYYAMLMYTSCGWFFDDISRIEGQQILRYACRAIELSRRFTGEDLEKEFTRQLELAKSNVPAMKNGKYIYMNHVKPGLAVNET